MTSNQYNNFHYKDKTYPYDRNSHTCKDDFILNQGNSEQNVLRHYIPIRSKTPYINNIPHTLSRDAPISRLYLHISYDTDA